MKVAVTGASGFIGRYVMEDLQKRGQEVIAVTREVMDIAHPPTDCFNRLGRPDVLIHLAWGGLPNYKSSYHLETELPRQIYFLKAMVQEGLPALLVTGTCAEYGMQSGGLSEDLAALPVNPYGSAKDSLRRQLVSLRTAKPFNLTWGRLFYMYGEGQSKNSLYSQLKDAVLREEKVFNMSSGEQLRDYLPVSEVARCIVLLALTDNTSHGIVNICSGKPISVRSLVERWLRENSWKIDLNFGHYPLPDYEPVEFWGDNTKLRRILKETWAG